MKPEIAMIYEFKRISENYSSGKISEDLRLVLNKLGIPDRENQLEFMKDIRNFFRHAPFSGQVLPPKNLLQFIKSLLEKRTAKIVCDPWASIGVIIATIQEATSAATAIAITKSKYEAEIGKVLFSKADWQIGNPLDIINDLEEVDVFASMLPLGMKFPGQVAIHNIAGNEIKFNDELGNIILTKASQKLSSNGIGIFVVPQSFFTSPRCIRKLFPEIGLGIEAAIALPSALFAPYTNIMTYLIIIRKASFGKMFVAEFSNNTSTNDQIVSNFMEKKEGGDISLGHFVDPALFIGFEMLRMSKRLKEAELRFGAPAISLEKLSTSMNLGRYGEDFTFSNYNNAIYIPLIGNSDVVNSDDEFTLKKHNYIQVIINPSYSYSYFISRFLNSEFGKVIRDSCKKGGVIPKLNKESIKNIQIFIPDLRMQQKILQVESKLIAEQNIYMSVQNELSELKSELWSDPKFLNKIEQRIEALSKQNRINIKEQALEKLDSWFETLPFPLASILRAWQATPTQDYKTKYEQLLHFFEASTEFISIIFLSAFNSQENLFEFHIEKLSQILKKQGLSLRRATFGTWKSICEYLSKQTRQFLSSNDMSDRLMCAEIFADDSLMFPKILSNQEIVNVLSSANKLRNDWTGHGGVVGQEEAKLRNEQILGEVQKLRAALADCWAEIQLIHSLHCKPRKGVFENEISILMGSNGEFLKETRITSTVLDVEMLYLLKNNSMRGLKLLPLIRLGSSPESINNACYFFNRMEKDNLRFISYHFKDRPELKEPYDNTYQDMKFLTDY